MEHLTVDNAVCARNVSYSYSKSDQTLVNLCMTIPKGTIYGLLGPSGCGKTTLLRCIVGLIFPKSGEIQVFGLWPGSVHSDVPGPGVGYMPQETALYENLTLKEILIYFGRVYFIPDKQLLHRIDQLSAVLDLPDKHRAISTFSGGQKRRTSFAVSLVHNPKLLILDEPTSGVDPVLREKIWQNLLSLCKLEGTTVILTTQYIEETRKAHKVGFMRAGQVIAEGSPEALMTTYCTKTLEDAFLRVCLKEKHLKFTKLMESVEMTNVPGVVSLTAEQKLLPSRPTTGGCCQFSFKRWMLLFGILVWNTMIRDIRNPMIICFQYALPISQVFLFAACIGGDPVGIPFGIINEEHPPDFSGLLLRHLHTEKLQLTYFNDTKTATEAIRKHQIWGFLRIHQNFTDSVYARTDFFGDIDPEFIESGQIVVTADLTDEVISITTYRHLFESYFRFFYEVFNLIGVNPNVARPPIVLEKPIYGTYEKLNSHGFRDFMLPGLIVNITFGVAFALTSFALIAERNGQTFERNFVAGVSCAQILGAQAISRISFMLPYVVFIIYLPTHYFNIPFLGSPFYVVTLLLLVNLAGMCYGIVLATLCRTIEMAVILAAGTLFILLFITGTLWPLEAVPTYFKWISYSAPTSMPTEAMRTIMFKNPGLLENNVPLSFLVVIGWCIFLFVTGVKYFKYNK